MTPSEAALPGASDDDVLNYSNVTGRVLVTQDSDFLRMHREQAVDAGIAYCRQGMQTIGQLVASH